MLSAEQIGQLITENTNLQMQVLELNTALSVQEEELARLRTEVSGVAELQSLYDAQLDELERLKDLIGRKQQHAEGAFDRQRELENELADAVKLQEEYHTVAEQLAGKLAQVEDLEFQLTQLAEENRVLQKKAERIGELESQLANAVMERDDLVNRMADSQAESTPG
jgi:chromosome segregation ATPase